MKLFELPDLPINASNLEAEIFSHLTIDEYNNKLNAGNGNIKTVSKNNLKCLAQEKLSRNYEVELFENGNIPTREHNWHDYFNLCIWVNFPKTKAAINYSHYSEMKNKTIKNRTPLENAMTLFDENGAVVLSSDQKLLDLIRQHEWKKLFWDHRQDVLEKMRVVVIGHSLYEKFLDPYIGMTAHSVLWQVDDINLDNFEVDAKLAHELEDRQYSSPKSLQPLPILGYPGWHAKNSDELFYDNADYFRPR